MNYGELRRLLLVLLPVMLLVTSATSCGSVDVDDILDKAGEVAEDAGKIVRDAIGGTDGDAADEQPGGGRTVSRPPRPTGTIQVGPALVVASQVVASSGGSVKVQKPGDPIDGLEIKVPAGAYAGDRQFNVSTAPITRHDFGAHLNPATPLITIENGGDYSEDFMTVRIPVDLPPDHFAMAFYYDAEAGTLEGIPFSNVSEDSITVVTRHFCTLLVSIIKNSVLDDLLKSDIDSHFRPGIDDWQFTNYGSYIAAGGHCAGQCLSALWYFCEQPDGVDLTLNGRYDKNGVKPASPDLWQDDSRGYRLASTIQKDINWSSFENLLMENLAGQDDDLAFKAFGYSIQLTGEPQEIGIFSSAGGGHDMICYRVHKGSLYIADPNYPGNVDRRIEFVNGKFVPYNSGANADEIAAGNGKAYETIQYCAKTATVDWKKIGARWTEFKTGTIGNDVFPEYEIVVVDDEGKETPLADGFESPTKNMTIRVNSAATIGTRVYINDLRVQPDAQGRYALEDGSNLVGIDIWGDVRNDPANRAYEYIDFRYVDVTYGQPDCYGWLLESGVPTITKYDGDPQFTEGFTLEVTDGSYTSEGRMIIPMLEDDSVAHFRHTGNWSPLPGCIKPDETVTLTISATSALEIIPPVDWGTVYNDLLVDLDVAGPEVGRINLASRYGAVAPMSTKRLELKLGEGWEGLTHDIIVKFFTETGHGEYRYTYVYHE
jgi:hypothetical protein